MRIAALIAAPLFALACAACDQPGPAAVSDAGTQDAAATDQTPIDAVPIDMSAPLPRTAVRAADRDPAPQIREEAPLEAPPAAIARTAALNGKDAEPAGTAVSATPERPAADAIAAANAEPATER